MKLEWVDSIKYIGIVSGWVFPENQPRLLFSIYLHYLQWCT